MRQSTAAVALIRREHQGQKRWLGQWNARWQGYHFIAGHKREDETFRQCAEREVAEELKLENGSDFVVAEEPLAHLEYVAWSEGAKAETQYTVELFPVELKGDGSRERIEANAANRWLTREEIRSGKCGDGALVSETMRFLLFKVEEAMNERQLVEFVGQAAASLPEAMQAELRAELENLFRAQQPRAVTVSRCYAGYSQPSLDKVVLGVEVRLPAGFETHIVKVGSTKKVAADFDGWQQCLSGRDFASRIFLPVRRHDLSEGRVAVLYRDAYTLFGPDPTRSTPESLETVVSWSVFDDRPDPKSVERAIANIYTDLARWLYYGADEKTDPARDFYQRRLNRSLHNWLEETADKDQQDQARRRWELRRDTIWLLCGAERPDSDGPADYLDPHDYVTWALKTTGAVPATLVGRSHGDLHGRNILLGVQRGEAEYPAVFDYGEMSCENVLVWDFVKLETELKIRLVPVLYTDDRARRVLLKNSRRARRPAELGAGDDTVDNRARRADRLEFAFRFERLLAERTGWIQGRMDAESRHPPGGRDITGNQKIDRLLAFLLRIRQEAALWLGYERGRQDRWQDEYYFALAVYGLVHSRPDWNYEPRQAECALLSAGIAAAKMRTAQAAIRDLTRQDRTDCELYPSYRVPLALIHRRWKAGRIDEALTILTQVLPAVRPTDLGRASLHHAVPLLAEHALLLAELGQHRSAEAMLQPIREGCRIFGDYETLCRIGRAYKGSGDEKWKKNPVPFHELNNLPARQMYRHALDVYREAFEISSHYYPGINAASLALLVGDRDLMREIARQVFDVCERKHEGLVGEEAVWVYASEGEAALLLGEKSASTFYASALDELDPNDPQMAQSMYEQLCRLWHALGRKSVEQVIREFEGREVWNRLHAGPLGDCGERKGIQPP